MNEQHDNWGIVGHEWAVQYLRRSLLNQRDAHAYLFAGPEGIGKALLAQRLAQALVCETGKPDPCLLCRACKRVAKGNHPDVRAVSLQTQAEAQKTDAAPSKKLGIDTIREWQRDIGLRPFEAQRRVFILDDAQALTDQAANAMLKTLEEPPPYAVLILLSHGAGDLLPTIVSRCRVLRLRPVARESVAATVRDRFNVDPGDAALVAAWSGGRLGWAVRAVEDPDLLEQQQGRLDELIRLGVAGRVARLRWAEERAKEYRSEPAVALEWMRLWQSWWRDVLLLRGGYRAAITHLDRRAELDDLARSIPLEIVQQFLVQLDGVREQLAANVNPQLAFENVTLHIPTAR
jgi:DNA polymerase III subunit delta'